MTTVPVPGPIGFDTLLARSWELFKRNWIVALPPVITTFIAIAGFAVIIGALVATALARGLAGYPSSGLWAVFAAAYLALMVFLIGLNVWMYAAVFGMADAAWERGTTSFRDGNAAFRTRGGAIFVAGIGITGLGIAALILTLPTLGLVLLAFPLAIMYVLPAVVSGGRGGFAAIGESFRLVRRFPGPSIIAILILVALLYGVSMLGALFILPLEFAVMPAPGADAVLPRMPPIGLLVGSLIGYGMTTVVTTAYYGYMALALTGLYRDLAPRADAPLAPAPPPLVPGPPPLAPPAA